jgi:membrane-bound lytic murein transglycosylase A
MTLCPRLAYASLSAAALCVIVTASAAPGQDVDPLKIADTQLEPLAWSSLDGWATDDHVASFAAFLTSCKPFLNTSRPRDARPVYGALWDVCRRAAPLKPASSDEARAFFEENFRPVWIARLGEQKGLLTGYYEPVVEGSRFPNPEFHTPLYRRPPDLLVAGRKPKGSEFPNKGIAVTRRNAKNQLEPYYDRAAIEEGALDGKRLEICWLKDPFDAFSIQIQGSARVNLEDGTVLRVNYDSHNGHPYSAVGRALIERNAVPRDQMSMARIHQWVLANPEEGRKVLQTNRSFVFFRITGLTDEGEAVGAQGVPLLAGRSIAVDKVHVYGTPFFIEADLPVESDRPTTKFRRLMMAQDTGSAIVGPARADLYWGAGDVAGRIAGRIRHQGRFVMLLPRALDMVEAGKHMPLPVPKPPIPEPAQAKKSDGKDKPQADKAEDDAKAPSAKTRKQAAPAGTKSKPRS